MQQPKEAKSKTKKAVLNHPFRILIMNCQSIKNKKAEIHAVIDSAKPDIILGNESWLTLEIKNSEIIVSNINKHLAFESILADCQHGFRSQRSCETQLVQFYHDMVSNLDGAQDRGQKQTDVIIMDFAKAFDKVPHRRLLYKLGYYGIRGSTHKWISSWLSERSQKVVLDGQALDPVPVLSGVPQGSVLGPVLFSHLH